MRRQFRSRGFGYDVETKLIGDWDKLRRLVHNLDEVIIVAYNRGSRKAANKYYKLIRTNIQNGGRKFGFPPLAQSTIDRKQAAGFDPRPFIFYGYYYRAVKLYTKKGKWYVGIKKGRKNPMTSRGSSYTIAQYASVLETGTRDGKIPARPLWRATFKEMGGRKEIKRMIISSLVYEIRKRYGISPHIT